MFDARRMEVYALVLNAQKEQAISEMKSYEHKLEANEKNLKILKEEYKRLKNLLDKNLTTKDRVVATERDIENISGEILSLKSGTAGSNSKIVEADAKKTNYLEEMYVRNSEEFKKNKEALLQLESAYKRAADAHERSIIRSPNDGVVTDLQVHTVGASLPSSSKVMEIIPQDDQLIIEAFVRSQDIDSINPGNEVKIQLNAFKSRTTPRIEGTVTYISADKFDKEMHGTPNLSPMGFYKVKIEVTPEEIAKINADIKLVPGMPVTLFIVKGTRTFAGYLYSPIKDSFHKAFKEV